MADHFYGVALGQALGQVSSNTSTTSLGVELRVEDGVTHNNKLQVLLAIEKIRAHIAVNSDVTP